MHLLLHFTRHPGHFFCLLRFPVRVKCNSIFISQSCRHPGKKLQSMVRKCGKKQNAGSVRASDEFSKEPTRISKLSHECDFEARRRFIFSYFKKSGKKMFTNHRCELPDPFIIVLIGFMHNRGRRKFKSGNTLISAVL